MRSLAPSGGGAKGAEPTKNSSSSDYKSANSSKLSMREESQAAGSRSAKPSSGGGRVAAQGVSSGAPSAADGPAIAIAVKHQSSAAKAEQLRRKLQQELGEDNLVAAHRWVNQGSTAWQGMSH
jgi:hypothetical protein